MTNNYKSSIKDITDVKVSDVSIVGHMASILERLDNKTIDLEYAKMANNIYKSIGNRHHEINASYRLDVRRMENELNKEKLAFEVYKESVKTNDDIQCRFTQKSQRRSRSSKRR